MAKKTNLQIAEEICEPISGNNAKRFGVNPRLYEGIINGQKFKRSSHWWSIFRTIVDGKFFAKELVSVRVNNEQKWSELEATSAPSGMPRRDIKRKLGDYKTFEVEANKRDVVKRWLSGVIA